MSAFNGQNFPRLPSRGKVAKKEFSSSSLSSREKANRSQKSCVLTRAREGEGGRGEIELASPSKDKDIAKSHEWDLREGLQKF